MKFFVTALFICSFALISGCSKDDPAGPEDNGQMVISGIIDGWNQGTDKTIVLYNIDYPYEQYGKGAISADGSFNFKAEFPANLFPISNEFRVSPNCGDTIHSTQKNVNIHRAYLEVVKGDSLIGYVSKNSLGGDTNYVSCFLYVDKEVSLTGTFECPQPSPNYNIYDLHFVKGWNTYYVIYAQDDSYFKRTTTDPQKMKFVVGF